MGKELQVKNQRTRIIFFAFREILELSLWQLRRGQALRRKGLFRLEKILREINGLCEEKGIDKFLLLFVLVYLREEK